MSKVWEDYGLPTGVPCPRCGTPVLYNGNYYCSRRRCHWALKEGVDVTPYLTGLRDMAVARGDRALAERCNFYLHNEQN